MQRLAQSMLVLASLLVAAPVLANSGGAPTPSPSPQPRDPVTFKASPREQAERYYADAYKEIKKGYKDLKKGKKKNAEKKFKKALKNTERAVELDEEYFEAWNLMGYSLRKLGDFEASLVAYHKCLKINPRYVSARDYLGEALVELGKIAEAREQLAWLTKLEAENEATVLKEKIDAWVAANPDAETAEAETAEPKKAEGSNE